MCESNHKVMELMNRKWPLYSKKSPHDHMKYESTAKATYYGEINRTSEDFCMNGQGTMTSNPGSEHWNTGELQDSDVEDEEVEGENHQGNEGNDQQP